MRVYYFSAAGSCRKIAEYFAHTLALPISEIDGSPAETDTAIVVFPVYCQRLPAPLRSWLPKLKAEKAVLIAAYGRMHPGVALQQAAKLCPCTVIAGANVPAAHGYLGDDFSPDFSRLKPILERIADPKPAHIPRGRRQLFAFLAPDARSRLGVKIFKSGRCSGCGLCSRRCPAHSCKNGKPGRNCIRCLRCVYECPRRALSFSLHPILKHYLSAAKYQEYELFL